MNILKSVHVTTYRVVVLGTLKWATPVQRELPHQSETVPTKPPPTWGPLGLS